MRRKKEGEEEEKTRLATDEVRQTGRQADRQIYTQTQTDRS